MINSITNAGAKVGDYQFTTLEPNLGDFFGHIIADIPGIIEGASEGKGLGIKFLKHIKKTQKIIHLVSSEDPETVEARYLAIRNELATFGLEVKDKEEIILLTKTDLVDEATKNHAIKLLSKHNPHVYTLSLFDDESIKTFIQTLSHLLEKKTDADTEVEAQ